MQVEIRVPMVVRKTDKTDQTAAAVSQGVFNGVIPGDARKSEYFFIREP